VKTGLSVFSEGTGGLVSVSILAIVSTIVAIRLLLTLAFLGLVPLV